MRAVSLVAGTVLVRAESAIGAPPRRSARQAWQHRIMPKGFVSEKDLDPRVRDLRICVNHLILETNNRRSETSIKCPRTDSPPLTYMITTRPNHGVRD